MWGRTLFLGYASLTLRDDVAGYNFNLNSMIVFSFRYPFKIIEKWHVKYPLEEVPTEDGEPSIKSFCTSHSKPETHDVLRACPHNASEPLPPGEWNILKPETQTSEDGLDQVRHTWPHKTERNLRR